MIVVINPYTVTELRINANRGEQMNNGLPAYGCGDQSSVKGERHLRVHLENSFTQFFLIVIIYSGTYSNGYTRSFCHQDPSSFWYAWHADPKLDPCS